ncbi:MAG: ribosome biogenesis GTPase Der [Coriobacteriales bacterium]|nr:ribosome biogenesis GTPase Der [Coriobacteriaceae bacterium]MDY2723536.1 ribosome biogenesis GTPase Der [Coriobacteriales bacterium]MDY5661670.1 ribosome biogenesis GTPase Der [Coriobacteriales bacterium]
MSLPIVAVVGRPNVGKSTLINRITQTEDAIVHEMRGVTRDRSYHRADWNGVDFMLIDTGGMAIGEGDRFQHDITSQALMACEEADCIIFLVDGRTGVTEEDQEIARILKRTKTPVILVVNKMDNPQAEDAIWEFYTLGLGDPMPVSSVHGHGTGDLLDEVVARLPEPEPEEESDDEINVAIIGRPNAGKSSLTNRLTGVERSIVSDVAGTTRDAIDTVVEHEGKKYRIVDTAGIRRKSQIDEDVEYYGFVRSLRAIDRAEVVLLMVDATLGLTDQDQRVAGLAAERGCAMVILINKWDLIEDPNRRDEIRDDIADRMKFVGYAPVISISAMTGRSVHRIWGAIDTVYEGYSRRVSTNQLNKLLTELRDFGHVVSKGNKRLRLNYVTQTAIQPPVFTFFANFPEIIDDSYERYLENRIRESFDFTGTPIRLKFKRKN